MTGKRNTRPRDEFGRPLPYGMPGTDRVADDYAPTAEEAIAQATRLLAMGRPFHAHEVFEARWKTGPGDERDLWQGLAQICVGLTHLQRDNPRGAAALLDRGIARISAYATREPYGMDLGAIERAARGDEPLRAVTEVFQSHS